MRRILYHQRGKASSDSPAELLSRFMKKYLSLFMAIVLAMYLVVGSGSVMASQQGKLYQETEEFLYNMYHDLLPRITNSGDRQRFISAEQAWIKFRDTEVNFYGRFYPNSKGGLALKIKLTEDRANYLRSIRKELPKRQGDDLGPISRQD
jgi:Lysozyme inhibitor LprI